MRKLYPATVCPVPGGPADAGGLRRRRGNFHLVEHNDADDHRADADDNGFAATDDDIERLDNRDGDRRHLRSPLPR